MGTPLKSALLKPGVVSSLFVGEQNAPGGAFSKSPRDEDDITAEPEVAPSLSCDLAQGVEALPKPACEPNHVTNKSIQV
ncbi:hypothetical protein MRX96_027677 [Rhipicephalus microplus]